MLETTMLAVTERRMRRGQELVADPAEARQVRLTRPIGAQDPGRPGPARGGPDTRAAPPVRVRALKPRSEPC